jgi:hypothetical protein
LIVVRDTAVRVEPLILIQQFSSFLRRRRALDLLPFLVLATGLLTSPNTSPERW